MTPSGHSRWRKRLKWALGATVGLLAAGAACAALPATSAGITQAPFGRLPDGTPVALYTLRNPQGAEARICTYGGILTALTVPDKHGTFGDVVLGYDQLDGYLQSSPYFGALIGRYANRIGPWPLHP